MVLTVQIDGVRTEAAAGQSLFDCAERAGVQVPTSCRKQGKCRECLVEVVEGGERLSPPSAEEGHLQGAFRLSCRAIVQGGEGEIRCHTLRRGALRIAERFEFQRGRRMDPAVTRGAGSILLDGVPIAPHTGPLHGIAIDLGTTTVVLRLVDLESGEVIAVQSFENPQRFAGSDVMARIQYDTDHPGRELQRTLTAYLAHAIEAFPCPPQSIYEITVAGNTTMRDLLFGLNVYSIGQRPYRSLTETEMLQGARQTTALATEARRLRLPVHPKARVYGLPLISGHVGGDAAACLAAVDWFERDEVLALMDIGTNTELLVGNRSRIVAASCPAGPAFEGGGLSCGCPGLEGAIESVRIHDRGALETRVIGGGIAEGICGSGLVELLSELLRTGAMNESGRLLAGERFVLDAAGAVFVDENDISVLAQAKAANAAGLCIVLRNYGIDVPRLDRFYLAGGFGCHLDTAAARRIGLIPDLPEERIVKLGNAAIEGATVALLSQSRRRQLENFVRRVEHVELETDPEFFEHFVDGCRFAPMQGVALGS